LAALALAASLPGAAAAQPIRVTSFSRVVDLTHTLHPSFPTYSGDPAIAVQKLTDIAKDGYALNRLTYAEHVGTHIDAPSHFSATGIPVDQIPAQNLVCPLFVIDISARAAANPDAELTPDDITAFEKVHGRIPAGACVALRSGWDARAGDPRFRNADAAGTLHFPGFRPDTAPLLLARNVAGVAVDTLSIDHGASKDFAFHRAWLGAGRWGLECAANLGQVPPKGASIVAGAPKFAGGTGGPSRVIALL
jgi:kynurenine formamidase